MNSSNSSEPTLIDPAHTKRRTQTGCGKRGARPGHPGAARDLLPETRVDAVVEFGPELGPLCGLSLRDAPTLQASTSPVPIPSAP